MSVSQLLLLTKFCKDIHGAQTIDPSKRSFSLTVLEPLLQIDQCGLQSDLYFIFV